MPLKIILSHVIIIKMVLFFKIQNSNKYIYFDKYDNNEDFRFSICAFAVINNRYGSDLWHRRERQNNRRW